MEELRELVNKKVKLYSTSTDTIGLVNLKKFKLIQELLKDDACFFKINFEDAYNILMEIGVSNPINYYKKLVGYKEYKKNKENFEI